MIYQMQIYYGALLNGQAIYSLESSLDNCTKFPDKINEKVFRYPIEQAILKDGFKLENFEIGYLTKEQYENRFDIEHENATTWTISK